MFGLRDTRKTVKKWMKALKKQPASDAVHAPSRSKSPVDVSASTMKGADATSGAAFAGAVVGSAAVRAKSPVLSIKIPRKGVAK